jgi:hypothetical protein
VSDMSLVVKQTSLSDMEAALTTAHDEITEQIRSVLEQVNARIVDWSPSTASRAAEIDYQRRLRDGVDRLARAKLAEVREDARLAEVGNVALVD